MTTGVKAAAIAAALGGRSPGAQSPTRRSALNYLGVVVGVAGVLTVVPALEVLAIGFRLGEIVWGVWLGIVMFRSSRSAVARKCRVFFGASDVVRLEGGRRFSATARGTSLNPETCLPRRCPQTTRFKHDPLRGICV